MTRPVARTPSWRRHRAGHLRSAGVAVVLTCTSALGVTACAGPPPDLDPAVAAELQHGVLAVSQALASQRFDEAVAALDEVRGELEVAADEGAVTASRYRTIDSALDAVAAEVAAVREAMAAEQAAAAAAEQAAAAAAQAAADAAAVQAAAAQAAADAAAQAAASQAERSTAPVPQPAPPAEEDGGNGNGNGNGRGKGD